MLNREGIAYRLACELPEGSYVNLGIGIPTLVGDYLPPGKDIFLHSENGILGMGPAPEPGNEDIDQINAGKQYVTMLPGGSFFDHPTSFSLIRGGHLTHAILGAFEVAANGDMANWRTPGEKVPGVGGAMDLAFGVKNVWYCHDDARHQQGQTEDSEASARDPCRPSRWWHGRNG